jgi:uncharacterized SAM-binding protein YcdF (DUF218 family)
MFFLLSKILGYFVYPLSLALLALLAFWARNRRREKPRWGLFCLGIAILWLCSMPWGSDVLLLPLERPFADTPVPAQADVIVVLGGALDLANSRPGKLEYQQASDRFMYAVLLAKQLPQAKLIFAGGTASFVDKTKTEASLLKGEAVRFGLAPERILVDDQSRNTRENALQAQRILQQTGGQSVVLITSAFHMRRSLACFRKVGVTTIPYAVDIRSHRGQPDPFGWVPEASRLADATSAVREYVGLLVYRLKGYI